MEKNRGPRRKITTVSEKDNVPTPELVDKVTDLIKGAEEFLIVALTTSEEDENTTACSFSMKGDGMKLFEAFLDSIEHNPRLNMLFKLCMIKRMAGDHNEEKGSGIINPFGKGIVPPWER